MSTLKIILQLSVGAVAALSTPALAQTEPAPADAQHLGDIVVTAQRVKENVQRVPISIAVVSGLTLQNEAKNTLDQALRDVPAVDIQASPQGGQIFIRGVGNNGDNNVVDSDVALMFDGVYSGRAETALSNAYDIDRIEVLRGPQGTLYGRNATGGVVNILSADPTFKAGMGFDVNAGNYSLAHGDAYINMPVSDTLSFRVAGMRESREGYYTNGGDSADTTGGRFKFLFKPSANFSLLGTFDYLHQNGLGMTSVLAPGTAATDPIFGNVNNPSSNPWNTSASVPFPYSVAPDKDDYRFYTYSLKADANLGFGTLTVLPALVHSNRYVDTNLFAPGPQTPGDEVEDQFTVEARLASKAGSHIKWVAGIYVLRDDNASALTSPSSGSYFLVMPTKQPATSYSAFGQVTYPVTSALRLTGGLRYNQDKKSKNYQICTTTNTTSCDGNYLSPVTTYSSSYSALTFKAGAEADLGDHSMAYAQLASGYKAGGYELTNPPVAYNPEHLMAYELGLKSRLLDNKLQMNLEAYYYRYNNYQVTSNYYVPYLNTLPAAYCTGACATGSGEFVMGVNNAATGTNYGVEIEMKYQPTKNDRIDGALALVHATYGDLDVPNPGFPTAGPPGTGAGGDPYNIAGNQVASTPHRVLNLGYTHSFPVFSGMIDVHAQSKISTGYYDTIFEASSAAYQPSFHKSDANITYKNGSGNWRVGVWVKNIEDKAQITDNFPFYRVMITDPRTFGINFSANF